MKKTSLHVAAVFVVVFASVSARAQQTRRVECANGGVRVEVDVCGQRSQAPAQALRPAVPPPVVAPAPAPVVPPALVTPSVSVARKPLKRFNVRLGLGLDVFPLDVSVRLSKNVVWANSGLIFGVGGADDGVIVGGMLTGLDWYFGRRAFDGLHIGMRAGFFSVHEGGEYGGTTTIPMARVGVGYDWVLEDFFVVGLEGGLHYTHIGGHEDSIHIVLPYLRLSGGIVF